MDDQALLEGIVVFSDEDGPEGSQKRVSAQFPVKTVKSNLLKATQDRNIKG